MHVMTASRRAGEAGRVPRSNPSAKRSLARINSSLTLTFPHYKRTTERPKAPDDGCPRTVSDILDEVEALAVLSEHLPAHPNFEEKRISPTLRIRPVWP